MSDSSPDPFESMPFIADMMRMLQGQGPVSWDAARQFALSIATGGRSEPNVDPAERISYEQLTRVAELQVAQATGLNASAGKLTVVPTTRADWAQRSIEAFKPLIARLGESLSAAQAADEEDDDPTMAMLGPFLQMMTPVMLGITAGSMVGNLAVNSLGQYDLPLPRPKSDELLVVGPNVTAFAEEWSLDIDDLRLWVCLHEVTHHAVIDVPHVRARLTDYLGRHAAAFQSDPHALEDKLGDLDLSGDPAGLAQIQGLLGDPEVILGAVQSDEQRELLPYLEALVAVIIGFVDHTMDTIGTHLMTTYPQLTEALRRRRVETSEADRFVERMLGLDLTQASVDRGSAFIEGVVERAGSDGLARLWASEAMLPTPAEVDAPGLWLARIDLDISPDPDDAD